MAKKRIDSPADKIGFLDISYIVLRYKYLLIIGPKRYYFMALSIALDKAMYFVTFATIFMASTDCYIGLA